MLFFQIQAKQGMCLSPIEKITLVKIYMYIFDTKLYKTLIENFIRELYSRYYYTDCFFK